MIGTSSSTTATASDVSAVGSFKLLSAAKYAEILDVEEEDVQEELASAGKAWVSVVGSPGACDVSSERVSVRDGEEDDDSVLSRLMTALGTTYSSEEHGSALLKLATPSSSSSVDSNSQPQLLLSMSAFQDWYIQWLYKSDDDGTGSDDEGDAENEKVVQVVVVPAVQSGQLPSN